MQIGSRATVDPLIEFERQLLRILAKFGEVHTMAIGNEEIGKFMMTEIREHEHMMCFFNKLTEENGHMKPQQKKEYIKVYGKAAQIFEESLIAYISKLLNILHKKAKDGQPDLHGVISDTLGMITFHVVQKAEDYETQFDLLQQVLKMPYQLLTKTTNKNAQSAGAQCLSKVVQNTRNELLWDNLDDIMEKISSIFKSNGLRAHSALLESLITMIFHLEEEFAPFVDRFIPVLIDQIGSSDWNVQKVGIDAINALTTTVSHQIIPHRVSILQALKPTRVHKMKPVREASQWTIKLLKESQPPMEPQELAILDDNPRGGNLASQRASIRDQKSPIRGSNALNENSTMKSYQLQEKMQASQLTVGGGVQPRGGSNFSQLMQNSEQRKSVAQLREGASEIEVLVPQSRDGLQSGRNQPLDSTGFSTNNNLTDAANPNCIDLSSQVQPTGKKVSIATLKRRQKALESAQKNDVSQQDTASKRLKSTEKSKERKPLFQRLQNATFFNKKEDDIQILEPKSGKPPLDLARQNSQPSKNAADASSDPPQRKSKAQRNQEKDSRRQSRQSQQEPEEDCVVVSKRSKLQSQKKEQELKNLRKFMNAQPQQNDEDDDHQEEEQDCSIKIFEPKKRPPPPQEAKNSKKMQVKDLEDDSQGDEDDDDGDQLQSPIAVRRLKDDEDQALQSSDSDKIAWSTQQRQQERQSARIGNNYEDEQQDDEDDDQIIWPTAKNKQIQKQKSMPVDKVKKQRPATSNANTKRSQQRYQEDGDDQKSTRGRDRESNFLSDQEPLTTSSKRQKSRLSKYQDYDVERNTYTEQPQYTEDDHKRDQSPVYKGGNNERHDFYSVTQGNDDPRLNSLKKGASAAHFRSQYHHQDTSMSDQIDFRPRQKAVENNFVSTTLDKYNAMATGLKQATTPTGGRPFTERSKWLRNNSSGGGNNHNLFSATQDYGQPQTSNTQHEIRMQNFMMDDHHHQQSVTIQQTAAQFDQYAYQSLSESLQIALQQIDQLNRTVKGLSDQVGKMQNEKNQLSQKVSGLEQLVLQLSVAQTQRSNLDGLKANMFEQSQGLHAFNKSLLSSTANVRNNKDHQLGGGNGAAHHHLQSQQPTQQSQFTNLYDGGMQGYSPQVTSEAASQMAAQQNNITIPAFQMSNNQQHLMQGDGGVGIGGAQSMAINNAMKLMMQKNSSQHQHHNSSTSTITIDNSNSVVQQPPQQHLNSQFDTQRTGTFGTGVGGGDESNQPKQLQWSIIDGLLQKLMFDEAFMMLLRQVAQTQQRNQDLNNDSMMLIKALGKVGSFIVNQISEPVKAALYAQLCEILAANEFIDFILSFMQEAILNYQGTLSVNLCLQVAQKLATLREQDLTRSLQSNQGSVMTMQQREAMESLVKKYRARVEAISGGQSTQGRGVTNQSSSQLEDL